MVMRFFSTTLFLLIIVLLVPQSILAENASNSSATCTASSSSDGGGCAWWDVPCHLMHFFEWFVTEGARVALKPFEPLINYTLAQPLVFLGASLPVFEAPQPQPFASDALSDAMYSLWSVSMYIGFAILAAGLMVSALWLLGEAGGVVRAGEAALCMKRALIIAVLIPISAKLYDFSAHLIALANSYILPMKDFATYCDSLAGTIVSLALISGLFGGWTFLLGVLLVGFVLLVLGAMRLLLTAVLASLLPVALALSVFPLSFVRRFGETMLSMLANLSLATIVCAAVFRFGAALAHYYAGGDWVETAMRIIVFFACALAPALSLVLAPRASIGLYLTSMFLGYVARPFLGQVARQVAPTIRAGLAQLGGYLETAAAVSKGPLAWAGRVVRVSRSLWSLTKHPGGVPGAAIAKGVQLYRTWKASREHPEESTP